MGKEITVKTEGEITLNIVSRNDIPVDEIIIGLRNGEYNITEYNISLGGDIITVNGGIVGYYRVVDEHTRCIF